MSEQICVIGAGSSGLTTVKALVEAGLPFDCFEMGSDIGGNWRYENDNGRSSAYDSLHIDTSKERMAFSDFPMPDHYPNFPHHSQVLEYFELYAAEFDLKRHITFRTKVETVTPAAGGGYEVTTRNLETGDTGRSHYRAVIVCNGHHWNERWPKFPGEFNGHCQHSHTYRKPQPFTDQNVVVVGIGNSGVDLACDLSHVAQNVYLSTRRSAYILPRYIMGKPTDKWVTPAGSRIPFPLQRLLYKLLLHISVGDQEKYGVPKPDHELLSEHPTMSAELLHRVAFGKVKMKPNIQELRGDKVAFVDGSEAAVDSIIFATGYQITFPFFDPQFFAVSDNDVSLYRHVVAPDHEGLYFIGLIQPLGAIMPLAELQAQWVAGLLAGTHILPDKQTMHREIGKEKAAIRKRYVKSARHTIQVDFYPYKRLLERELTTSQLQAVGSS